MKKKSTVIGDVGYNANRLDLTIRFKNGKEYIYTPVISKVAEKLVKSKSAGKYFNEVIKNNPALTCSRVVN